MSFCSLPQTMSDSAFNSSSNKMFTACRNSIGSKTTNTMFSIFSTFLLLPLFLLILYMGFQRWRRPAAPKMSHTDFFTYNMMVVESVGAAASVLYTVSLYVTSEAMFTLGMFLFSVSLLAQTFFHALTCVERHLAVVHPVTYMHLRETLGVRMRNGSSVCVWLLSVGWLGLTVWYTPVFPTVPFLLMLGACVFVVCFCCLSVLRVLTRSGPGEQAEQSKQRALHMIVAIAAALLLRFVGLLVCLGLSQVTSMGLEDLCATMDSGLWFTAPSSLVLPLLYLHRAGKLTRCRENCGSE